MKKYLFFAAFAVMSMACTKDAIQIHTDNNEKQLVELSFTAFAPDTRVAMGSDRKVSFVAGDKISVFANGTNYEFTTTEGGAAATFTGTAESASTYYALYPYQSDATIEGGVIKNIAISKGSAGTGVGNFNSKKAVSVAVTDGDSFNFKQVCALLMFDIPATVTDLKEIVVFNRASAITGSLAGTFSVTPSSSAAPVVEVTTAEGNPHQAGMTAENTYFETGKYYLPVLPANLTQGLDMKFIYADGTLRAFSNKVVQLESGKVYNMGTIVKTDRFVYNSFENNNFNEEYTGNKIGGVNVLKIVENPYKTTTNNSNYVMVNDMSTDDWANSGYFQTTLGSKFPSGARGDYATITMKMYWGTDEIYPRFLWNKGGTATLPARLNGETFSSEDDWKAKIRTSDWNVLEWDASQFSKTSFSDLQSFQVRCWVTYSNATTSRDDVKYHHIAWIDDITFVVK